MKPTLFLAAAFALCASTAFAQTVAPGTTPGATTGNPTNMPSAGSETDHNTSDKMDNGRTSSGRMRGDKRRMKDGSGSMKVKTKTNADGTTKTKM